MKPLRPIDVADLRCLWCCAPSFTVEQLIDPDFVDGIVTRSAVLAKEMTFFHAPCATCAEYRGRLLAAATRD